MGHAHGDHEACQSPDHEDSDDDDEGENEHAEKKRW